MIKFQLTSFNKALAFQVLEQDEKFREATILFSTDTFSIRAFNNPSLDVDKVHVRGNSESYHNDITVRVFKTNEQRDAYKEELLNTFRLWEESKEKAPDNDIFVYPSVSFQLVKLECALAFQVHSMDEKYRNSHGLFESSKGLMSISSADSPELGYGTVYLRGAESKKDHEIDVKKFASNEARDTYFDCVIAAFDTWEASSKTPFLTQGNGDIYTFNTPSKA